MLRIRVRNQVLPQLDRYAAKLYMRAQRLRTLLSLILITCCLVYFWPRSDKAVQILLIDEKCLSHLHREEPCPGPVKVAVYGPTELESSPYIAVEYYMQEVYDLTNSIKFSPTEELKKKDVKTTSRLLPRFVLKKNAQVTVGAHGILKTLELAVPADVQQFRKFWTNGRLLECVNDLEESNGTTPDHIDHVAFAYEKLRQRADVYGARIFLIEKSLETWYRKCHLPSPLHLGIYDEDFSQYLSFDISQHFTVSKLNGKRGDSLQLNLNIDQTPIVLNVLYRNSEHEMTYVEDDTKKHFIPRYTEFCAAAISSFMITVPCDVVNGRKALFEPVF